MAEAPTQPTDGSADPASQRLVPLTILAQYLKDLSFESPESPNSLGIASELRPGSVGFDIKVTPLAPPNFEVAMKLKVHATKDDKTIYMLELEYAGVVQIGNVSPEVSERLLMIEAPRMLFPFARAIVTQMTKEGGFAPLLINPVDFSGLFRDMKRRAQAPDGAPAPPAAAS